jgi:hypothetical protein
MCALVAVPKNLRVCACCCTEEPKTRNLRVCVCVCCCTDACFVQAHQVAGPKSVSPKQLIRIYGTNNLHPSEKLKVSSLLPSPHLFNVDFRWGWLANRSF